MSIIYLDIFSGISGDMFLGALLDLGVDFAPFQRELGKLRLKEYHLHVSRQKRSGIEGVKFDVHLQSEHHHPHEPEPPGPHHPHEHGPELAHEPKDAREHAHGHHPDPSSEHGSEGQGHEHVQDGHHHGRTFFEIKALILHSALSDWVKKKSIAIFQRIAAAEGKIHGQPPEEVHFHEVGAMDSIVDIVGACIALEMLGRPRLVSAPVVEGQGWIDCAHGRFPIPAPATLEILGARGVTINQCDGPHELVTPTGAALLAELCESFGPMRDLAPTRIGYGIGARQNQTRPNVLRAILKDDSTRADHDWQADTIAVLETNLDDITAEILGAFVEKALAAGALDVFHTAIQMKKSRPGVLLTVLCPVTEADMFSAMLLRETSAFGVRRYTVERRKLRREFATVSTAYGDVTMKFGRFDRSEERRVGKECRS